MIKVCVERAPEIAIDTDIEAFPEVSVVAESNEAPEVCVCVQSTETSMVEIEVASESSEEVEVDVLAEFVPTESGGSCLPAITSEDNGKFLRASGGRWLAQDDDCEPISLKEIEALLKNFT